MCGLRDSRYSQNIFQHSYALYKISVPQSTIFFLDQISFFGSTRRISWNKIRSCFPRRSWLGQERRRLGKTRKGVELMIAKRQEEEKETRNTWSLVSPYRIWQRKLVSVPTEGVGLCSKSLITRRPKATATTWTR